MHPSYYFMSQRDLLNELEFQAELVKTYSKRNEELVLIVRELIDKLDIADIYVQEAGNVKGHQSIIELLSRARGVLYY